MSSARSLAVLVCLVSFAVPPARAAERWIRLSTPHFEMYTTNGERQATAALQIFEQVRYFFLQNSSSKSAPDATVRIIAFRSEKEYKPYRLNGGAFAYYLRSRKVDYIVMQDISPEHYQTAAHEYTHLIVEHLGLKLPLWLNEGLADLYSSLEARGNQALIGRPLPGRMQELSEQRWLDLNTLFGVTEDSPYYNESDKMSIFYAESWALTHMLALGKGYQPAFMQFLGEAAARHPSAECLEKLYGKNPAQVMKELQRYVNQSSVKGAIYNVKLKSADLEPEVADAAPLQVDLALADLLASNKNTAAEAGARLARLAVEHPESADVEESLGYLAWQQGDTAKAKESFARAIEKGSKNPEMMLHFAVAECVGSSAGTNNTGARESCETEACGPGHLVFAGHYGDEREAVGVGAGGAVARGQGDSETGLSAFFRSRVLRCSIEKLRTSARYGHQSEAICRKFGTDYADFKPAGLSGFGGTVAAGGCSTGIEVVCAARQSSARSSGRSAAARADEKSATCRSRRQIFRMRRKDAAPACHRRRKRDDLRTDRSHRYRGAECSRWTFRFLVWHAKGIPRRRFL